VSKLTVSVKINGQPFTAEVDPRTLLLDFVRDDAGLTGAKRGCNEGKCGACTLLLDGLAVKACNVLAARADGASLLTIEGLATDGTLSPIQQAFHENHGLQCGFCTSGMILMTHYLLQNGLKDDEAEIRDALHGNVCRCTGYQKIVEAVVDAVRQAAGRAADQLGGSTP
jgi:glyceraldehyde dehydrogenase small subunit